MCPQETTMMSDRRQFLLTTAALGVPTLGAARAADEPKKGDKKGDDEEVTASEDLMREHGVLNRLLLIFEEGVRQVQTKTPVSLEVFHDAATLVRKFVEDYHEKLEEKYIFPAFEKHKELADLVKTLRKQHEAGRQVTDMILRQTARTNAPGRGAAPWDFTQACQVFIRMYRPHEAREDTVLFPALPSVLSARQIKDLGEQFEKEEDRLFGEHGFEKTVEKVAALEKALGIYDLDQFTPKLPR
jgi:hemerythrin-like domain-containing protein